MNVRSSFLSMSSAFFHLLLGIRHSQGKVYEIKVSMNDSPFFQCHVSDGCSANSPQITALLDRQKQMNSLPRGKTDSLNPSKTPKYLSVDGKLASIVKRSTQISTDKIRSHATIDEYHERGTDRRNIFLFYLAPILVLLFSFGSILNVGVIYQLYKEYTIKKSDIAKGVVGSSGHDNKIYEICAGKNWNESYVNSIEKKLAAISLMKARLEMEFISPEGLAVDLTTAVTLREKVLNQVKAQEEEIRDLQARFAVSCRIAHELIDELHQTLLHTTETLRIQCVRRTSLHGACLPGGVSHKSCEVRSEEIYSKPAKSRQLSITLADSVILRPSRFIPIFDTENGSNDSDYLSAMTGVKKKLAEDLNSMNLRLSSKTRETLNSFRRGGVSTMCKFESTIGFDRRRKSDDNGSQCVKNSEDIDDDNAPSKSQRIANQNGLNDNGHRISAVGTDLNTWEAHHKKSTRDLRDQSTDCTRVVGLYKGSSASNSDMDEDDDNDDRSCFRPLTLFSMSSLSNRKSPTATVSTSADNTGTLGESHDKCDVEIARLTDDLETNTRKLLMRKRDPCMKSPPAETNNVPDDLNWRLGLNFSSDFCSAAISNSIRTAPSKIPRRLFRSSSNPPIIRFK